MEDTAQWGCHFIATVFTHRVFLLNPSQGTRSATMTSSESDSTSHQVRSCCCMRCCCVATAPPAAALPSADCKCVAECTIAPPMSVLLQPGPHVWEVRIIQEYCNHGNLREALKTAKLEGQSMGKNGQPTPPSLGAALVLAMDAASGLGYIHGLNVCPALSWDDSAHYIQVGFSYIRARGFCKVLGRNCHRRPCAGLHELLRVFCWRLAAACSCTLRAYN